MTYGLCSYCEEYQDWLRPCEACHLLFCHNHTSKRAHECHELGYDDDDMNDYE